MVLAGYEHRHRRVALPGGGPAREVDRGDRDAVGSGADDIPAYGVVRFNSA